MTKQNFCNHFGIPESFCDSLEDDFKRLSDEHKDKELSGFNYYVLGSAISIIMLCQMKRDGMDSMFDSIHAALAGFVYQVEDAESSKDIHGDPS